MNTSKSFRIALSGSCWETQESDSQKVILRSPTKRDLVFRTMELAQKESQCRVIIHRHDGSVEEEKEVIHNPETKLKNFLNLYQSNL